MAAPANRRNSPLLAPTLDALLTLGGLPERVKVHPDRAYDSNLTQQLLQERGLEARTRSSSWGGSSEKRGETTVGRADLITDHDLLAQALRLRLVRPVDSPQQTETGPPFMRERRLAAVVSPF
jgi:hypothetical protein